MPCTGCTQRRQQIGRVISKTGQRVSSLAAQIKAIHTQAKADANKPRG